MEESDGLLEIEYVLSPPKLMVKFATRVVRSLKR
jgi:hypothetical protein